jgi:hypothetical protein
MRGPSLTREELRSGLRRLSVVIAALAATACLLGAVFTAAGATARAGLAAGTGVVGVALVLGGVGAFARTGSLARRRAVSPHGPNGQPGWTHDNEPLAFGLLVLGAVFSGVSLALG